MIKINNRQKTNQINNNKILMINKIIKKIKIIKKYKMIQKKILKKKENISIFWLIHCIYLIKEA